MINTLVDVIFATKPTWHHLETLIDKITRQTATAAFGKVVRNPLYYNAGTPENPDFQPYAVQGKAYESIDEIWTDTAGNPRMTAICPATESHQVQEMGELLDILEAGLSDVPFTITSLGTHSDRGCMYISAELIDKEQFIVGGEAFGLNFNLVDYRNKLGKLTLGTSQTRVVCNNTSTLFNHEVMAMMDRFGMKKAKAGLVKDRNAITGMAKHTKNFRANVEAIKRDLPIALASQEAFARAYGAMQKEKVSKEQIRKLIFGLMCKETEIDLAKGAILSTRAINAAASIIELAEKGKGNNGSTVADVWNGITEYYTTGNGSGNPERVDQFKRFVNSEYATGARIKRESLLSLTSDEELDSLADMGEKLLANAMKAKVDLLAVG